MIYCDNIMEVETIRDKVEICEDKKRGRFMIAKQDFEAGEVLYLERWSVVGPSHTTDPVCLNCLVILKSNEESTCPGCGGPVCKECDEAIGQHSTLECRILTESFHTKMTEFPFHSVMPLRLALEASKNSDVWKSVEHLSDHKEDRKRALEEWELFDKEVVEKLLVGFQTCQLPMSSDLLHKCIGIIRINAMGFDLRRKINNRRKGRLLFRISSMASHNCINTAIHIVDPDNWNLAMKARCEIKAGEEISISYVPFIIGEPLRSHHIQNEWFFNCKCKRCIDPTNNQSFISAIFCKKCQNEGKEESYLLPTCTMETELFCTWKCEVCKEIQPFQEIHKEICEIEKELRPLCESDSVMGLKSLTDFIEKHKSFLHKNHFLFLIARRNMLQILKKSFENCKQMQIVAFGSVNLKQKHMLQILAQRLKLSSELLPVIRKLDPNPSDWLKFVLTELIVTLTLLRSQFSTDESEMYKKSIPALLKESSKILGVVEKDLGKKDSKI